MFRVDIGLICRRNYLLLNTDKSLMAIAACFDVSKTFFTVFLITKSKYIILILMTPANCKNKVFILALKHLMVYVPLMVYSYKMISCIPWLYISQDLIVPIYCLWIFMDLILYGFIISQYIPRLFEQKLKVFIFQQ